MVRETSKRPIIGDTFPPLAPEDSIYDGLNIGLLRTRNEADIIEETLTHNLQFVDTVFAIDGSDPGDKTPDIIRSFDKVEWFAKDTEIYGENWMRLYKGARLVFLDHLFKVPLEKVKEKYGDEGWITVLFADEFYTVNARYPITQVYKHKLPERHGIPWNAAWYFAHVSERDTFDFDTTKSVTERFSYRVTCFPEPRQFRNAPGIYFPFGEVNVGSSPYPRGIDHSPLHHVFFNTYRIAHYQWRSIDKAKDRVKRRTNPKHSIGAENFFLENLHGYYAQFPSMQGPQLKKWQTVIKDPWRKDNG